MSVFRYPVIKTHRNIITSKHSLSVSSLILVNGGWGEWTEWGECSATCGSADQGRTRACDNPAKQYGGADCGIDGSLDSETQKCNEDPCPSE